VIVQEGVVVACGGIDGELFACHPCSGRIWLSSGLEPAEIVSVEILTPNQVLGVSRAGVLFHATYDVSRLALDMLWAKQGWRLYVSTICRRHPHVLISDGFGNVIRTLRVGDRDDDAD